MRKNLIIGSNSNIVRRIKSRLKNCDMISHRQMDSCSYDEYKQVFLFSWSRKSLQDNIDLITEIPSDKLIFISTTATNSIFTRKQWANYPNWKLECERYTLERGGRIIRLGVTGNKYEDQFDGCYLFTEDAQIVTAVDDTTTSFAPTTNLGSIEHDQTTTAFSKFRHNLIRTLHSISTLKYYQILVILVARLLGSKIYGYTFDTHNTVSDHIQIGAGAFGSYFYSTQSRAPTILVSGKQNAVLRTRGFNQTQLGRRTFGLGELWHRVYLQDGKKQFAKKQVFNRWKINLRAKKAHVTQIEYAKDKFTLTCSSACASAYQINSHHKNQGVSMTFYCRRLTLSAGTLENIKLLNSIEPSSYAISDHELAFLGTAETKKAIQLDLIRRIGPILLQRPYTKISDVENPSLVDVRPVAKADGSVNVAIYLNSAQRIVGRLVKSMSFRQINQAIFNRFGFSFYTKRVAIYQQILAPGCIDCDKNGLVRRTRLPYEVYRQSIEYLNSKGLSLKTDDEFAPTVDAQHIWASPTTNNPEIIQQLLDDQKLSIIGAPSSELSLNEEHHTHHFREAIIASKSGTNE